MLVAHLLVCVHLVGWCITMKHANSWLPWRKRRRSRSKEEDEDGSLPEESSSAQQLLVRGLDSVDKYTDCIHVIIYLYLCRQVGERPSIWSVSGDTRDQTSPKRQLYPYILYINK